MRHILTPTIKKHDLFSNKTKKYNLLQNNQEKPKKYRLINPSFLNIILNSEWYDSGFDDPFKGGIKIDDLNYRMPVEQREKWVELITSGDSRIIKVKGKKNYVVLVLKNITSENGSGSVRYMTFVDEKKSILEGELNVIKKSKVKEKEKRLYNVQSKPRIKRRSTKKIRRK